MRKALVIIILSTICFMAAVESVSELAACPARGPQEQKQQVEELEVRISAPKRVVVSGAVLQLRVEIWNMGTRDLFVCKDFQGPSVAFCHLRISFDPVGAGQRALWAADTGFQGGQKESFVNALVRNWVSIPPRHFYGAVIELDPSSYPELNEVGRYRVSGRYISGGLLTTASYNDLKAYPKEVAQLPGKSWQGKVDTNSVVVHVIASKK